MANCTEMTSHQQIGPDSLPTIIH